MEALEVPRLRGVKVEGWDVKAGMLHIHVGGREAPLICPCGAAHLLPTEHGSLLLVRCHHCGSNWSLEMGRA